VNKTRTKERKLKRSEKANSPQWVLSPWREVVTECHNEGKASRRARSSSRDHVSENQSSPWRENLAWRDKAVLGHWRMTLQKPN